jgi:hypothetical protein
VDFKHLQVAQNMLRLPEGKRPRRRAAKQQHLRMILLLKSCSLSSSPPLKAKVRLISLGCDGNKGPDEVLLILACMLLYLVLTAPA